MSVTIKSYLYPNDLVIQVIDPTIFTTRDREVYSRPIKVYQGIDNPIQITVRNQDQKPVDLTGYDVQVDIQDYVNQTSVTSVSVTWANIQRGEGNFTITSNVVNQLEQRFYSLTTRTIANVGNVAVQAPLYIDDNFGAVLDLQVLPGYLPGSSFSSNVGGTIIDGGSI